MRNVTLITGLFAILLTSIFHSTVSIARVSQKNGDESAAQNLTAARSLRPIQISRLKETTPPFLLTKDGLIPVTQLRTAQECTAGPHRPLQRILGVFETYANISQLLLLPETLYEGKPLVCPFQTNQAYLKHFAHAMQQIYLCYSFYQQYPLSSRKILVMTPQLQKQLDNNPFLHGFLRFLQDEVKVEILSPRAIEGTEYVSPRDTFIPGGYVISHTAELNRQIQNFIKNPEDSKDSCAGNERMPKIGILNRRPAVGRSIRNAGRVVDVLKNLSRHETVSVEYFEGSSFEDQVAFFQRIDILLSPHGAQNTGIPFMANKKCSHLLELFPQNYLLPTFYGSLARNAGIAYSYLYLSTVEGLTSGVEDLTLEKRVQARSANLCLAPHMIRQAVSSLMGDWRACCEER